LGKERAARLGMNTKTGKRGIDEPEWETSRKVLKGKSLVGSGVESMFHFGTVQAERHSGWIHGVGCNNSLIRNLDNGSRFGTLRVTEGDRISPWKSSSNEHGNDSRTGKVERERKGLTMQQIEASANSDRAERTRLEAVVEKLAGVRSKGETLAEVAHDARNMVTALGLYCDLLEEPGVLDTSFLHYGSELRLVAAASRRLVEKLIALDSSNASESDSLNGPNGIIRGRGRLRSLAKNAGVRIANRLGMEQLPARPIDDFAAELMANRNLLASLVGPSISLIVDAEGGALPVEMTREDLTRVLVNLVKNAADSMPAGGRITFGLREFHAGAEATPWLVLTVVDNGPGIPRGALEKVFDAGYTTHSTEHPSTGQWPGTHRGLGLSITRSILEAAGGRIRAENHDACGGHFIIELPVRMR